MLKEASEYDKRSASNKAADKDDFNEALLDGPKKQKTETQKPAETVQVKEEEPLGFIQNIDGVPKCVIDDPYLEPFKGDLMLR